MTKPHSPLGSPGVSVAVDAQLKAQWARQIFTGGAKPPKEMASDDEILKFVANTPGAIAYMDSSKVNKTVKVIKQ